jgi:hypothetical protein
MGRAAVKAVISLPLMGRDGWGDRSTPSVSRFARSTFPIEGKEV